MINLSALLLYRRFFFFFFLNLKDKKCEVYSNEFVWFIIKSVVTKISLIKIIQIFICIYIKLKSEEEKINLKICSCQFFRKKYETCGGSLTSRFIIAGWKCQVCIIEISVEYLSLKKYFYIEIESNELIIYLFSIIKWIWHFKKVQKHDFNILKIIRFVMSIYLF